MKDLRTEFNAACEEADRHGGDFRDCLLHYLSKRLEMPVINPPPRTGYTDGGVNDMGPDLPDASKSWLATTGR